MQAKLNQWYVRWFLWNCRVMDRFLDRHRAHRYETGTNLCHFFRTLALGSMITLLSVGMWAYVLITVFVMPFMLFNFVSVAVTVGTTVGIFAVALTLMVLVTKIADVRAAKRHVPKTASSSPGIMQVAQMYVEGLKHKFCAHIKFDKDSK